MDETTETAPQPKKRGKTKRATLAERFMEHHKAHPWVYTAFKYHADRLRRRGHEHLSALYICYYLSFETPADMRPDVDWKIDHDFGPFYARMLRAEDETYGALFEYRPSQADGVDLAALVRAA
jgi:hypothetical protein